MTISTDRRIALVIITAFILLLVLEYIFSQNPYSSIETNGYIFFFIILIGFFLTWWGVGSLIALIFKLPALHFLDALISWTVAIFFLILFSVSQFGH